jgi:amidophosphoribosyltransferase
MNNMSPHSKNPFDDIDFDEDKLKEECGIFGVYGHEDAATLTVLGLHALQHRGQEATGIVSYNGKNFNAHRAPEMVGKAFGDPAIMTELQGHMAIGHNRYSTTGETSRHNIQPLYADLAFGGFAVAHNGNLTNAEKLRRDLVLQGSLFQSTSDTEVILHLMARVDAQSVTDRFVEALKPVEGAYSLVATEGKSLIGVRDPHGIRPLVLGRLDGAHILASESCALDIIGAEFIRDVEPGELIVINEDGVHSKRPFDDKPSRLCVFEYIYFARPDSFMDGKSVYEARKKIGAELAREAPCPDVDLVVPVPDSGVPAAIGYAEEAGKPFELGIIRSHYIGRTFIQPTDKIRHLGVKMKHNANRAYIKGKKIVLIDDSIVRGTTSKKIVEMMRQAGATEVHMRISSPPNAYSCFYGIDTPSTQELLAHQKKIEDICEYIGADSLAYLSIDGLYKAVGEKARDNENPQYCDACFTGEYTIALTDHDEKINTGSVTNLREHQGK